MSSSINQPSSILAQLVNDFAITDKTTLLDLDAYETIAVAHFSSKSSHLRAAEVALPLLRGKAIRWTFHIPATISTIFLKLGTGNRMNHCHVTFAIFRTPQDDSPLATASIDGQTVQDNHWTELVLNTPIKKGDYLCQVNSPDSDNAENTLFLWITTKGLANYCYVSPPTADLKRILQTFQRFPTFTIGIIVTQTSYLTNCLQSLVNQVYPYWEVLLVTTVPIETKLLENIQKMGAIISLDPNSSITTYYNTVLAKAQGEYTLFLQPTDLLTEDALLEVAQCVNATAPALIYSDEDRISPKGLCYDPYFKPDWAPEILKGQHYTGQLTVYHTALLKEQGGCHSDIQPAWDMTLRFTEHTRAIQHLPKILCHRYEPPLSTQVETLQIIQAALNREGYSGQVTSNPAVPNVPLIHYPLQGRPLVSILIPTRDLSSVLARCLEAVRTLTDYPRYEIIIIDNNSGEIETFNLFAHYQQLWGTAFKVIQQAGPFNFSQLVNRGAQAAQGDILLLLNNDTELLGPANWLQEMIGFAQHPAIGCVSCKLLYPEDHTIQHAGLICGISGVANHSHKHFPAESNGYFNRLAIVSNYSAVIGACLLVRKSLWEKVDGFDEQLVVAYNDVDFCLKLLKLGYRHVVLPHIAFYHYESKTRGLENTTAKQERLAQETVYMQQRWGARLSHDPYYNQHLTHYAEDFTLNPQSVYYFNSSST